MYSIHTYETKIRDFRDKALNPATGNQSLLSACSYRDKHRHEIYAHVGF